MKLPMTVVSVKLAHPTTNYGQLAKIPLEQSQRRGLGRVGIPSDIPENAIVTKADIVLHNSDALTGSRDFVVQQLATSFAVSKATWNNQPGVTGSTVSVTIGAVAARTEIRVNVLSQVQAYVAGSATNRGWRISTTDTTMRRVQGPTSANFPPYLDLEYVVPGDAPVDLSPAGGAVSIAKPTLTFVTSEDTTSIQVQIDAAQDEVTPDFDSGTVGSTAGVLALTATAYAGLSDGATTSWRARALDSTGWSDWSEWATFSRTNKPTVTITAPSSTSGDKTPPVTWTAAGQVTWEAIYTDGMTGKLIQRSGLTTSADLDWTPTKGLKKVGDTGTIEVRVIDAVERVATPGDPVYAFDTQTFTLVAADAADGVDALVASAAWFSPEVHLSWAGDAADEWQIVRDGEWLERIDGLLTEWADYTAKPRTEHVYQVLRVSDGVVSPNGPLESVIPRPIGAWLVDPESGDKVLLVDEEVTVAMAEQAIVHNVIDAPPVRRRAGTPPPSGTATGNLVDGYLNDEDLSAAEFDETLMAFKGNDAGQVYRLVWADKNYPVTIGEAVSEAFNDGDHKVSYAAGWSWWHTGDEPWGV